MGSRQSVGKLGRHQEKTLGEGLGRLGKLAAFRPGSSDHLPPLVRSEGKVYRTVERPGDWSACGVGVIRKRLPARKTLLILCVAG